jgi:hypothetical protein
MFFFASRAFKSPGAEVPRRRVVSLFSRLAIRSPSLARVRCKVGPLQELPELPGATDRPSKVLAHLFRRRRGCLPVRVQRDCLPQPQTLQQPWLPPTKPKRTSMDSPGVSRIRREMAAFAAGEAPESEVSPGSEAQPAAAIGEEPVAAETEWEPVGASEVVTEVEEGEGVVTEPVVASETMEREAPAEGAAEEPRGWFSSWLGARREGGAEADAEASEAALHGVHTLRSWEYPQRRWRVADGDRWRVADGDTVKIDEGPATTLRVVPGLYRPGDESGARDWNAALFAARRARRRRPASMVSFALDDGTYLRHAGYNLRAHRPDGSKLFRLDATFYAERDRFFPGSVSFHSVNYNGFYISHGLDYVLKIQDGSDEPDLHRENACFVLERPAASADESTGWFSWLLGSPRESGAEASKKSPPPEELDTGPRDDGLLSTGEISGEYRIDGFDPFHQAFACCRSMTVIPRGPDAIETYTSYCVFVPCIGMGGPFLIGEVKTRDPGTNDFWPTEWGGGVLGFSADGTLRFWPFTPRNRKGGRRRPGSQKRVFPKVDARDLAGDWCTFYLCSIVPWPITPYVWTTKKALDEDRYEEKGQAGILCCPIIPISTETYTRKYVNGHPTNGFVRGRGGLQTGTHWYRDSGCAGSPGGCFVAKKIC